MLSIGQEAETPPEPPKTLPPPKESLEIDGIHQAIKALVTPEDETMPSYTETSHPYTSDSDLSYVNSYDVEHSQIVKKSKNENVQIPIKPQGLSYRSLDNDYEETPVARPRILGAQPKPNGVQIPIVAKPRVLSLQSNSVEESYNSPPKVLHQKKDNTLISRIYKDPRVRLFSLQSREDVPGSDTDHYTPTFYSPRTNENKFTYNETTSVYLNNKSMSDDGVTSEGESGKTGKMSFFSSEEDLLSLNSESSFRQVEITSASNGEVRVRAQSPRKPNIHRFSSHEDLLSIDEHTQVSSIPRRKDNTLISKIYQDPNVRNFANKTNHKEFVDDYQRKNRKSPSSEEKHTRTVFAVELSSPEISLEVVRSPTPSSGKSENSEIDDLARKHVVSGVLHKLLGTEAFEDVEDVVDGRAPFSRSTSVDDLSSIRVSVRDLRMKFESSEVSSCDTIPLKVTEFKPVLGCQQASYIKLDS